jgi:hypothetical protein
MSGFQLSGDAPTIYNRVGLKLLEPWTDDLTLEEVIARDRGRRKLFVDGAPAGAGRCGGLAQIPDTSFNRTAINCDLVFLRPIRHRLPGYP